MKILTVISPSKNLSKRLSKHLEINSSFVRDIFFFLTVREQTIAMRVRNFRCSRGTSIIRAASRGTRDNGKCIAQQEERRGTRYSRVFYWEKAATFSRQRLEMLGGLPSARSIVIESSNYRPMNR